MSLTLLDLPLEDVIVTHVAKFLDVKSVYNIWNTSTFCRSLAEKMLSRIEVLDMTTIEGESNPDFWQAISDNCKCLKFVKICHAFLDESFSHILDKNPLIESLDISHCNLDLNGPLTFALKNLKRLVLEKASVTEDFIQHIGLHAQLTTADLNTASYMSYQCFEEFLEAQPSLQEFTMRPSRIYSLDPDVELHDFDNSSPSLRFSASENAMWVTTPMWTFKEDLSDYGSAEEE